jgi:hypothetical protein
LWKHIAHPDCFLSSADVVVSRLWAEVRRTSDEILLAKGMTW